MSSNYAYYKALQIFFVVFLVALATWMVVRFWRLKRRAEIIAAGVCLFFSGAVGAVVINAYLRTAHGQFMDSLSIIEYSAIGLLVIVAASIIGCGITKVLILVLRGLNLITPEEVKNYFLRRK